MALSGLGLSLTYCF